MAILALAACCSPIDIDRVHRYAELRMEVVERVQRELAKIKASERPGEELNIHEIHEIMRRSIRKHAKRVFGKVNSHLPDHKYSSSLKNRLIEGVKIDLNTKIESHEQFVKPLVRNTLLYKLDEGGMIT